MWYFFTFAEIMQVYVLTCFCHHIPEQLAVGRNAVESGRFAYFPRNQTKARGARTLSKHRRSHEIGGVQISGFDIVSIAFPYSQSQSCWISSPLVTFLITQSSFSTSPGGEYSNKKKCSSNNAAGLATFGVHFLVFFSSLFWKVAFSSEQVGLFLFYQSASSLSTDSVFLRKSLFSNGRKKERVLFAKYFFQAQETVNFSIEDSIFFSQEFFGSQRESFFFRVNSTVACEENDAVGKTSHWIGSGKCSGNFSRFCWSQGLKNICQAQFDEWLQKQKTSLSEEKSRLQAQKENQNPMKAPKEDSALELTGKTQPLRRSYSKDTEPLIFKMGEENLYRKRLISKGIGEESELVVVVFDSGQR